MLFCGKKQSTFTVVSNKINPPFDFGVDRVDRMDWFYDLVTTGRPWEDSKLAEIIPLFLRSTGFYGKRCNINWVKQMESMDRALGDLLQYVIVDDIPQQCGDSKPI